MRPYVIVDVFTGAPLEGNPLAVFTEAGGLPPDRMQRVAREMNLSETVFVLPPEAGGDARIRIFTPATELPFAGHPTLGTAFVLCGQRGLDAIDLETGAGVIAFGQQIEVRQGEEIGRPSVLLVRVEAAGGQVSAVEVGGSAVIVARGELLA